MDKYHPGYFGKVGMRHFHLKRGISFCPTVNVDRLWSMMPEGVYDKCKADTNALAPVIDVTKLVSQPFTCHTYSVGPSVTPFLSHSSLLSGLFQGFGQGISS
jgi:hypothetical protein